jgi:hypothetical protein
VHLGGDKGASGARVEPKDNGHEHASPLRLDSASRSFDGRTFLVAGSTGGIGLGVARRPALLRSHANSKSVVDRCIRVTDDDKTVADPAAATKASR